VDTQGGQAGRTSQAWLYLKEIELGVHAYPVLLGMVQSDEVEAWIVGAVVGRLGYGNNNRVFLRCKVLDNVVHGFFVGLNHATRHEPRQVNEGEWDDTNAVVLNHDLRLKRERGVPER
jgi:hypothetical protein